MFEGDVRDLDLAGLLAAAGEHHAEKNRLEVRLLELALHCADLNHPDSHPGAAHRHGPGGPGGAAGPGDSGVALDGVPGGERGSCPGGPGTPPIREFVLAEFGAMLGISAGAAGAYIGDALVLRHKLPRAFAMVLGLAATPWKARKIAAACRDLSEQAAAIVDRKVCGIIDTLTPDQLAKIVKAALWQADPEAAEQTARQKARERGVYIGRSNDHGTKSIWVLAATGDVIRFDGAVDAIAQALKTLGDTTTLQNRRAKAIGILADPHYAAALLTTAREHTTTTNNNSNSTGTPGPTATAPDPGLGTTHPAPADADPTTADLTHPDQHRPDQGWQDQGWPGQGWPDPAVPWPDEPDLYDNETDRDAPHPGHTTLPNPHDSDRDGDGQDMDPAAQRALTATLARIKHQAHTTNTTPATGQRPGKTEIYIHLTDQTLKSGTGVLRVEGIGPMLASQLTELIGHGPYVVKPVIDLNQHINTNAYEIPDRIREHIRLTYPVEQFPYGNAETTPTTDIDHITPYDPSGPPGQTSTDNLVPLRRFSHRLKTHGRWRVQRHNDGALTWTSPHGFTFRVDHTGTHRIGTHRIDQS